MPVTSGRLLALTTQALLGFSREEDLSPLFREYLGSGTQRTCRAQGQSCRVCWRLLPEAAHEFGAHSAIATSYARQ